MKALHLSGTIPPEVWNRLGTKIIPKLRSNADLKVSVEISVTVNAELASGLVAELRQILRDLNLQDSVQIDAS